MHSWRMVVAAVCLATAASAQDDNGPYGYTFGFPAHEIHQGSRPVTRAPFPAIKDWKSVQITLRRTVCMGSCPAYTVTVHGDGTVDYQGWFYVAVSGHHKAQISPQAVQTLFDAFVKADFFWTYDRYVMEIYDIPDAFLAIRFDGHNKTLADHAGRDAGIPKEIEALEDLVDTVAETEKWVGGNDQSFASLQAEHWDFHSTSDENLSLIASAAHSRNIQFLRQVLAAGVSAKSKYGCIAIAENAYEHPDPALVDLLLEAGAPLLALLPPDQKTDPGPHMPCSALLAAVTGGNPKIVKSILARHPALSSKDLGALLMSAVGNSSMHSPQTPRDFAGVVRLLIEAGADVNYRDERGDSAIMTGIADAAIVRALIAAGAKDVNARNDRGETALMLTYEPAATQALLEGGADPWITNNEGRNALEAVRYTYGPNCGSVAVLKVWMATHPKPPGK